jgi:synaptobrevin family protein YKT6
MRIVSIHIFKWKKKDPVLLCEETQLEGLWFFQKKTAGEHIRFSSRLIAQDTELGMKQGVKLDGDVGMCYCWTTSEGLSVTTITDMEYPESSAFNMLGQIIIDFMSTFEEDSEMYTDAEQDTALKYYKLEEFLKNWQNPADADKIYKIKTELTEVKEIMHKNMEDLLERGESLDTLMAKSKDLSTMSVEFYKKAKKKNAKCCTLT